MAKKKMGGLGKGLDSLFADLSDDTGSEAYMAMAREFLENNERE